MYFESSVCLHGGMRWGSSLGYCAACRKVAVSIPDVVIGIFFIDIFIRSHNGSRVDSDSNRNEYQEYFLRVTAAGT